MPSKPWQVILHPEAVSELKKLPERERAALMNAVDKLINAGPALPYPHSSAVILAPRLRELRPRAGRSPWRAFYQQVGDTVVVAAIGPEAQHDQRGFNRAVMVARQRLDEIE